MKSVSDMLHWRWTPFLAWLGGSLLFALTVGLLMPARIADGCRGALSVVSAQPLRDVPVPRVRLSARQAPSARSSSHVTSHSPLPAPRPRSASPAAVPRQSEPTRPAPELDQDPATIRTSRLIRRIQSRLLAASDPDANQEAVETDNKEEDGDAIEAEDAAAGM